MRKLIFVLLLLIQTGCEKESSQPQELFDPADLSSRARSKQLLEAYGCVTCHVIPGLPHRGKEFGPPLSHWKQRKFLAGRYTNDSSTLKKWIMNPKEMDPNTSMPDLGVKEREAEMMTKYLFSLE